MPLVEAWLTTWTKPEDSHVQPGSDHIAEVNSGQGRLTGIESKSL